MPGPEICTVVAEMLVCRRLNFAGNRDADRALHIVMGGTDAAHSM